MYNGVGKKHEYDLANATPPPRRPAVKLSTPESPDLWEKESDEEVEELMDFAKVDSPCTFFFFLWQR